MMGTTTDILYEQIERLKDQIIEKEAEWKHSISVIHNERLAQLASRDATIAEFREALVGLVEEWEPVEDLVRTKDPDPWHFYEAVHTAVVLLDSDTMCDLKSEPDTIEEE
jgi:hypothetical protein